MALVPVNQHVTHISPFPHGSQFQTVGQFGGQVLQTVHGQIRSLFEQGNFQFFGEKAFG